MRKLLTILLCIAGCEAGFSQFVVSGKVIDGVTGESLERAGIKLQATSFKLQVAEKLQATSFKLQAAEKLQATSFRLQVETANRRDVLTDDAGRFQLPVETGDSVDLVVSFIGYQTKIVNVKPGPLALVIPLEKGGLELKEVIVTNNGGEKSFHTLSHIDLNMQPARSAQDLLRLVPGLFIAQHQGGGKAEQIFLRGFDADHGTDVNVSVDGMPVNMVSHAHGQGYADLHFLIPETVSGYDFGKGPYYANRGDFTTAGYVAYHTAGVLDRNMIKLEGGEFHTGRVMAMVNLWGGVGEKEAGARKSNAWVAGEGLYTDGPFDFPEHFSRLNLMGKFITQVGRGSKFTASLSTFSSGWRASGEIPGRAVEEGYVKDRFGVIDSAQGGYTSRTNVNVQLQSTLGSHTSLENQVFYSYYFFNLVSNFTFYYYYPQTGDEFRQRESRNLAGTNSRIVHRTDLAGGSLVSTLGIGTHFDRVDPAYLAHVADGTILDYIQLGKIQETNLNGYLEESFQKGNWLLDAGLRMDYLHFNYANMAPAPDSASAIYAGLSPSRGKAIVSPKINIQYNANPGLQFYVKVGKGFHSNDARIVIANQGFEVLPAAFGADLGFNWKPVPGLFVNAALWYLWLQQEFVYGADLGDQAVQPGGKTRREGVDLSMRYQFNDWLYGYVDVDLARPRSVATENGAAGPGSGKKGTDYLPLAPGFTSTGGLHLRCRNGVNGSISYRYMHDRPANEDYTLKAEGYWVTDMTLNYTKKKYEVGVTVENLLNTKWNESQFAYASRFRNEARPVEEVSYTPGTPLFAKLKFSVFF
jgi:hypothetical protein